jgi:hypothetical protein
MIRLYLDWNIFTTLRQTKSLANDNERNVFEMLQNVISSNRAKIILPYSNGHLNDLLKSYKKGERERVKQSLKFISFLTQDICLTQYHIILILKK